MEKRLPPLKRTCIFLVTAFLFTPKFSAFSFAQPVAGGEIAACKLIINKKSVQTKLNQIGYFDRVYNIRPLDVVSVEMHYPKGNEGEKVVVFAEDGGTLDNGKTVKVALLDNAKKCAFAFQVANQQGIYRLTLRKGNDNKVIQLWVGPEPAAAKH